MIRRKSVQEFERRPMKDSRRVKALSEATLDRLIEDAGLLFEPGRFPRYAQKVAILLAWMRKSYLVFLGMGGGKTKISIDLFVNRRFQGDTSRCLVLVPNVVNLSTWEHEAGKEWPAGYARAVTGTGADARWRVLEGRHDIVVVTYQGLTQLCSRTEETGGNRKWKIDLKQVKRITDAFDFLVLDECTAIKNHRSLHFKLVRALAKKIPYRLGLTGTPFDKNPEDLWSQFFVIDGGYTLGETIGLFRAAYFREVKHYFGVEYRFREQKKEALTRRIANCSVRFTEEDCQDLPSSVGGLKDTDFMVRPFELSEQAMAYHEKFQKDIECSKGSYAIIDSAYTRQRMIASGWVGAVSNEGERLEFEFDSNPKVTALLELLSEMGDERAIVMHWFNTTGRIITDALQKAKIDFAWIYGKTRNKREELERFSDPKGPRILVASGAISKGVNLQGAARFMVFAESPDSVIERAQMEARIRREGGLEGTRYYYDLVGRDTIEERILSSLRGGKRRLDEIVDQVRSKS